MNTHSFTVVQNDIAKRLITSCGVSGAFSREEFLRGIPYPPVVKCHALWDTGSTSSAVSTRLVSRLGLKAEGKASFAVVSGLEEFPMYNVNIVLSDKGVVVSSLHVPCAELDNDIDVIIGMDVITLGDMAITNENRKTTFSFQIPSATTIDFEKQ